MSSSRRKTQIEAAILRNAWAAEGEAAKYTSKLARQGDRDAARDILRDIAEAIELSSERKWVGPIPWVYALYIAEAFRKIVMDENTNASLALGIKQKKAGRPRGTATHDKSQLAAAYWLLMRRGRKPEKAIRLLSEETGADRTTIQRAAKDCSRFRKHRQIDDELLKFMAGPRIGAALSRILDAE